MCGRFLLSVDVEELLERYRAVKGWSVPAGSDELYGLERASFLPPATREIFPTNTVPIVTAGAPRRLEQMYWGFTPPYAKGPIINARSETADIKPMFREALSIRRCIVPADAFFEWKKEGGRKLKMIIRNKERSILSLAGLYGEFPSKEGAPRLAFAILTTVPNPQMAEIHDRMPVILPEEAEVVWLDPKVLDAGKVKPLLQSFDPEGRRLVIAPYSV